jgi:hypothetical protein
MALNDAALVVGATSIKNAITHLQLFSATPNATGTTNTLGTRVASTGAVDADGDITWTNVAFTGLGASATVAGVGYWSASTAGTFYGYTAMGGGSDTTANAAGEYTVTSVAENSTAT